MDEARSTVRLAEGVPFDVSTRGVTATLRRSEIEQAARSGDESVALVLDVRRSQGADVEAHSLAVEWSQADLDRLLREADGADEVTIAFDRDEMGAAIDETDVEAHGLREKALVLTVVAVSALSTAGAAQAMPGTAGSGDAAPVASAASPTPVQSPATTIGGAGSASTVASETSPATTIGGAGPAPTAAPADSTGATASPETQVRGEAPARTLPSAVGDSSLPSGQDAALIGAAGLAIAAAGFAAAGTRPKSIRPA